MPLKKPKVQSVQEKLTEALLQMRDAQEKVFLVPRDKSVTAEITVGQAMISHWLQGQILKDAKEREKLRYYFGMFEADALKYVVQYMQYKNGRKTKPPEAPLESYDITKICSDPGDAIWIKDLTPKTIFEILKIAGILEIPSLIGLVQARIACWCKNRTAAEITEMFSAANYDKMPEMQQTPFG